jgi:hypothetical protein
MLIIKRKVNKNDKHSGELAFPGGRCEKGENDLNTSIRET